MPYRQADTGALTFYVRAGANTPAVLPAIAAVVRRLDANIPISNLRTMEDQIRYDTSGYRALTMMSSAFAGLAIVLAAIGLYAVLAYGIAQRLREIGIRIALGATPGDIRGLVLGQVGRISIVGVGIGAALALRPGPPQSGDVVRRRGHGSSDHRRRGRARAGGRLCRGGRARTASHIGAAGRSAEGRIAARGRAPNHLFGREQDVPSANTPTERGSINTREPSRNGPLPRSYVARALTLER